jgi:serine phosphatase RsbU (regulator of sigma subunit)
VAEIRADETARLERGLVPHPIVADPGVWIASRYLPGRRRALIGGDFYDVVEVAGGRLHVVMGDVSGRGPDEAALGAALRIAWRALTLSRTPVERVLHTLQSMIEAERQDPGTFATVCTLEIDPRARTLALRRAGHPAPMLLDDGSATSLPLAGGGPPIGMFETVQWPASEFRLPERWAVLLYTDGVIEGRDADGTLLGEDGLRSIVDDHVTGDRGWRSDPSGLLGGILERIRRRQGDLFSDDVALLALGAR